MAHNNTSANALPTSNEDSQESSPLLNKTLQDQEEEPKSAAPAQECSAAHHGWTANGLPLGHGSVVGEPMGRAQWDSGICDCLGRNDDFCSSDLEVCLLGSVAPCVLYGTNAERLGSTPGTFANHCLPYTGLYFLGNSVFGWNCLAPWFSYTSRTAMRRRFNLEATASHWTGHADAAVGAAWKRISNVSNARQHVILQLMYSAIHVPFARKAARFDAGCLILALSLSRCW
ncbi:Cell number regulator 8 [Linum grandiflorum]